MAESGIIFAKSTSSPILTTTQSVPASLLMSETPNDVNNDPYYTPNDIYKPKSSPTNAISPSNSIITLPMMSTKERLRERNLEVRELKERVKRKDTYILNLAKALKAAKAERGKVDERGKVERGTRQTSLKHTQRRRTPAPRRRPPSPQRGVGAGAAVSMHRRYWSIWSRFIRSRLEAAESSERAVVKVPMTKAETTMPRMPTKKLKTDSGIVWGI